jgi:hypothetical protein
MDQTDHALSTRDLATREATDESALLDADPRAVRQPIDDSQAAQQPATESAPDTSSAQATEPVAAPAESHTTAGLRPSDPRGDQSTEGARAAEGDHDRQAPAGFSAEGDPALLSPELATGFQGRWEQVQTRFVDEPRGAVEDADSLVASVMKELAEGFAQERERLEGQWGRGEDISTEDLRVALQRYRSFFQRLLAA